MDKAISPAEGDEGNKKVAQQGDGRGCGSESFYIDVGHDEIEVDGPELVKIVHSHFEGDIFC